MDNFLPIGRKILKSFKCIGSNASQIFQVLWNLSALLFTMERSVQHTQLVLFVKYHMCTIQQSSFHSVFCLIVQVFLESLQKWYQCCNICHSVVDNVYEGRCNTGIHGNSFSIRSVIWSGPFKNYKKVFLKTTRSSQLSMANCVHSAWPRVIFGQADKTPD